MQRLQLITYVSTALLIIGLLYFQSWAQWPMFSFADGIPGHKHPDLVRYSNLVSSLLQFTGIEYTLTVAAFVLPVSYILNRQADGLAADGLAARLGTHHIFSHSEIARERAKDNLLVPFSENVKAIAAVMAPFVAGTFNNIMSGLG